MPAVLVSLRRVFTLAAAVLVVAGVVMIGRGDAIFARPPLVAGLVYGMLSLLGPRLGR